jgi:hypothetical protein
MMLNLRFTGWHRYKATNTVTLVYQGGSLVQDALTGKSFRWLPTGRSLFRDKRVPRENLNGLAIERDGLSKVLYSLTGMGGPWAQDPPYFARVEEFNTGEEYDSSTTFIDGWHGWSHRRTIFFYHPNGPLAIIDNAHGPSARRGALLWHADTCERSGDGRIQLRRGNNPVEMLLYPTESKLEYQTAVDGCRIIAHGEGELHLATIFLLGEWVGASVRETPGGDLELINNNRTLVIPFGMP